MTAATGVHTCRFRVGDQRDTDQALLGVEELPRERPHIRW
jgi:hypothetical protein